MNIFSDRSVYKKMTFLLFVLCTLAMSTHQKDCHCHNIQFSDYPVSKNISLSSKPRLDLTSHPDAKKFRTALDLAIKDHPKPNFAGHYILTQWGCGTECQKTALVEYNTGRVIFGPTTALGAKFEVNSRLFIANSPEAIKEAFGDNPPDYLKTEYYRWNGKKFERIAVCKCEQKCKP